MEIKFRNKKIVYILLSVPCLAFCIFLNMFFVPALIFSIESHNLQEILFCSLMIFIFLIAGAFGVFIALQAINHLVLKDDYIEGYYNGKIKIYYKDIECISTHFEPTLPNSNEICILLHNGKSYHITNVKNIDEVYKKVFISSPNLAKDFNDIKVRKEKTSKASKSYYILIASLIVIMFVAIFICVGLTGARDIPEFNETDKIIFTYFIIFEFVTVITLFLVAILGAKYVRNKWVFDNMLRYLKAKQDKDKNLEQYTDKLISVKYKFDYSLRLILYRQNEKELFAAEWYVGNSWRGCIDEFTNDDETAKKYFESTL